MEKVLLPPPPTKRLIKTALHQAVLDERLHQVRLLLTKHGADPDCRDVHGRTALMLTCIIDDSVLGYRMARVLLEAKATANMRDGMGRTALSYACMNGREKLVRLFLKADNIDLTEADSDANTPMHHAVLSGSETIVRILAQAIHKFSVNPDIRNLAGDTPLLRACKYGHYVAAYLTLTIAKASPTLRDQEFQLTTLEWLQREPLVQSRSTDRKYLASAPPASPRPLASLSFERDESMYSRPWVPVSRLYRVPNPYHAIESTRLPEIAKEKKKAEVPMDNAEARLRLLQELGRLAGKVTGTQDGGPLPRWLHPSTAKLRSRISMSRSSLVPDIVAMFKIYCEQYEPDWRTYRQTDMSVNIPPLVTDNDQPSVSVQQ
ncbi:ankyrin repeat domain-containing protein 50-like isoform X2 [Physella acuta]|uniref:ankyrin repeat domain-containing protein 50-like isoform X2 n=1 Tax=Physella acuta TaxID=109671 RepID=UPI0027DCF065|nr:ankyrin repeat domain-containing protein 50-like isoform X2 [Physella acuta]